MASCNPTSSTCVHVSKVDDQSAVITSAPELRLRQAPGDCSDASRSASQAIQQATQQASQSVQQAQQSASQNIQQASQSASQSIRQAQQSASQAIQSFSNQASQSIAAASQSIAAASRSVSSALSSASAAVASAQSSADQAISIANESMLGAQTSAANAESVLKAAVAAATGSAAAAGASFLSAAAQATQGAQASIAALSAAASKGAQSSISAFGAQATAQISQASLQANVSQTLAITATNAALAIVGSIIASALITIVIYFLLTRHKRRAMRNSREQRALEVPQDRKYPASDERSIAPNDVDSPTAPHGEYEKEMANLYSPASSARKSQRIADVPRTSVVKTTTVKWNPKRPPKAPTLTSFLTLEQNSVSPFGPIALPDVATPVSLGGQLRSPLQSTYPYPTSTQTQPTRSSTALTSNKLPDRKFTSLKKKPSVAARVVMVRPSIAVIPPKSDTSKSETTSTLTPFPQRAQMAQVRSRLSQSSEWTDQSVADDESPMTTRGRSPGEQMREITFVSDSEHDHDLDDINFPQQGRSAGADVGMETIPHSAASTITASGMQLPKVEEKNVRTTAEWLNSPSRFVAIDSSGQKVVVNEDRSRFAKGNGGRGLGLGLGLGLGRGGSGSGSGSGSGKEKEKEKKVVGGGSGWPQGLPRGFGDTIGAAR